MSDWTETVLTEWTSHLRVVARYRWEWSVVLWAPDKPNHEVELKGTAWTRWGARRAIRKIVKIATEAEA